MRKAEIESLKKNSNESNTNKFLRDFLKNKRLKEKIEMNYELYEVCEKIKDDYK